MEIAIIGTGLIGSSIALAIRSFHTHILGVDKNSTHAQKALELGIID